MAVDLNRITAAAVEAFLDGGDESANRRREDQSRHGGGLAAVALGVGLAITARAAYRRVRDVDLERLAGAVEDKLRG